MPQDFLFSLVASGEIKLRRIDGWRKIPIVFVSAGDPIAFGLVASLSRPSGNVTGISMVTVDLAPKRLELLHELVPAPAVIAMLVNPTSPYVESETKDVMGSARVLGRQVQVLTAATPP